MSAHVQTTEGIDLGTNSGVSLEETREVVGPNRFIGPSDIRGLGIEIPLNSDLTVPFSLARLALAERLDEDLIFVPRRMTARQINCVQSHRTPDGGPLSRTLKSLALENFYSRRTPDDFDVWLLVSRGAISASFGKSPLDQTAVVADHLLDSVYCDIDMSPELAGAIEEFRTKRGGVEASIVERDWKEATIGLAAFMLRQRCLETAREALWVHALRTALSEEGPKADFWTMTNTISSRGGFVTTGFSKQKGILIRHDYPSNWEDALGVRFCERGIVIPPGPSVS